MVKFFLDVSLWRDIGSSSRSLALSLSRSLSLSLSLSLYLSLSLSLFLPLSLIFPKTTMGVNFNRGSDKSKEVCAFLSDRLNRVPS